MSQDFFDQEIIADFIAEAKEHLETIEPNLLELEKSPDALSLLNDIFRPMHSLKGASGFLGFNRINQLAHKCENILDELRKGAMHITPEIMDVILASTDALNQIISNLETRGDEGDVETQHLMEQIDDIMSNATSTSDTPPAPEPAPVSELPAAAAEPADETASILPLQDEDAAVLPAEAPAAPSDAASLNADDAPLGMAASSEADTVVPASFPAAPEAETPPAPLPAAVNVEAPTPREWIAGLPLGAPYALVTFGEGHLKDFIEEAREIIEDLNQGLLQLEESSPNQEELIHDIFRYFHNLKGNSGIICFNELNQLTHEAETVLNSVRKGEMAPSHELVDLLLLVVDFMEVLINHISLESGQVSAPDISALLTQLRQVNAGGAVELPPALRTLPPAPAAEPAPEQTSEPTPEAAPSAAVAAPLFASTELTPIAAMDDDVAMFRATVQQQQNIIASALDNLEKDGQHQESIDALYRCLIAIRNACNFVGLTDIKVYADRTASIVDQGRKAHLDFSLMLDLMRQETAIMGDMLTAAQLPVPAPEEKPAAPANSAGAAQKNDKPAAPHPAPAAVTGQAPTAAAAPRPAPKPAPAAAPRPAAQAAPAKAPAAVKTSAAKPVTGTEPTRSSSTIRVDHEKLDHLMNLIGELIINRNRYSLIARHLEEGGATVNVSQIAQSLSETTYAMARISDELQDTIMKVRMVPVSTVFTRFPRLVRDLSRKIDKEVELIMEGEETELDKSVVEVIGDPMVHLIRNAVDHGIEPEAERLAAGKPAKGTITLRAFHKGNSVAIEIEDDGKGIDPEKMREVAVRKGILSQEEAAQLDEQEAIELIFAPGFSSAEQITDISGRGVGMDVVRTNIKNLKGSVSTLSVLGKGTRFTLMLPLTLAIIDALMVNVAGETYAIPLDAVSETTKLESARLTDINGRHAVTLRGEVLGIVELAELLGLPHQETLPEVLSVVVIHANERRLGLVVDNLVERQEIVIKPLGSYLGDLRGLSGATIMGDGSVILILDPHEIYKMSTSPTSSLG